MSETEIIISKITNINIILLSYNVKISLVDGYSNSKSGSFPSSIVSFLGENFIGVSSGVIGSSMEIFTYSIAPLSVPFSKSASSP